MNRTEYMRQLESLLQNISATEREEALQYYNEYFNDAGPENEQNVIEALGNPAKVAENIKKDILWNGYGENSYQRAGADSRSVITYPADPQTENGNGEQRNRQSDASQTAQAQVVSPHRYDCADRNFMYFGIPGDPGSSFRRYRRGSRADRRMVRTDHRFRGNGSSTDTGSDRTGGSRDHQYVYASLCGNVPDRCRTDLRRYRTAVPDADRGHGGNRHTGDLLLDRRIIPEKR